MDYSVPGFSVHGIFPGQEYWSGLPFPSPVDLPEWGIKSRSPALWAETLPLRHQGSPIPKKHIAKERSNYHIIALISHASKVMHKIRHVRLQQYMNQELPDVQAGFRKGREEPEIKLPTSVGSYKKHENSTKISTSASLTMLKPLCGWQQTAENS